MTITLPATVAVAAAEGGDWVPFGEHRNIRSVYAIKFSGDLFWDVANGWRGVHRAASPAPAKAATVRDAVVQLLLSRLAEHQQSYMGGVDAGRIEELCWLIREIINRDWP